MTELLPSDIEHLGRLARLALSEEETTRYAGQLSNVVGYVEELQSLDVSGVDRRLGVTGKKNVFAEDTDAPYELDRSAALASAARHENDFIVVPAVLGGEESA